jgi:hypothetical protein
MGISWEFHAFFHFNLPPDWSTFVFEPIRTATQIKHYGHRIPQAPVGKERERHRILQESTGYTRHWKQYSRRKFVGIFPVDSSEFPVRSVRNRSEIIEKNPKNFRREYCFHFPAISGAFLPEPVRLFRPGYVLILY